MPYFKEVSLKISFSKNYNSYFMQATSWCDNYSIFNFLLKPWKFWQEDGKFQKFKCLKNQKSILGKMKSIFHIFSRDFLVKYKKIAERSYKKEEISKEILSFFDLQFSCPTANFSSLLSGQCYSSNVNQCVYSSFDL